MRNSLFWGVVLGFLTYCCVKWMVGDVIGLYMQIGAVLVLMLIGGAGVLATYTALDKYDQMYRSAVKEHLWKFCIFGAVGCMIVVLAAMAELCGFETIKLGAMGFILVKLFGAVFLLVSCHHILKIVDLDAKNAQLKFLRSE